MPDIPAAPNTTANLLVGDRYLGSFEEAGDHDWIAIQLQAGVTYTFNLGAAASSVGQLTDTTLGLYDSSGALVAFNDDVLWTSILNPGIGGPGNWVNTYSSFTFTATETGTFYLDASTIGGAQIGNYVLQAHAGDLPAGPTSPAVLEVGGAWVTGRIDPGPDDVDGYALATVVGEFYTVVVAATGPDFADWLLSPDISVSDGVTTFMSTKPAGFAFPTVQLTFQAISDTTYVNVGSAAPYSGTGQYSVQVEEASPVDAIEWDRTPISEYFVYFVDDQQVTNRFGDTYFSPSWTAEELAAAQHAFDSFTGVTNVSFTVVDDPALANTFMTKFPDTEEFAGRWFPYGGPVTIDGVVYQSRGFGEFAYELPDWYEGLAPGGTGYWTLVHELGHGLGLNHPFGGDFGGSSLPSAINNWEWADFGLSQSIYTVMAYNPGLSERDVRDFSAGAGGPMGPMALDIAALQQTFGANMTTRTGDDTYVLPEGTEAGTGYLCIWDAGGTDVIAADAANTTGVTIDLRAASLRYDSIGGGALSWAPASLGGFTIAHGVVIENATGASGNDRLVGNEVANLIQGNDGADTVGGGAGDDTLLGGDGDDALYGDILPGAATGIGFGSGLIVNAAGADNNLFVTAQDLTNQFALSADPDVAKSDVTPHVTIQATGDGSIDVYSLTLNAGATATLDMDHTTGGLDGYIEVYDADFTWLGILDDGLLVSGAGGSTSTLDTYGSFRAWDAGKYYFIVYKPVTFFMNEGEDYVLHVSVDEMTAAVGSGVGNDLLDGGTGADSMAGGAGDDTYIVDNAGDSVTELDGEGGADEVRSSVTYSALGTDVERIVLTGGAATTATGQALDNVIIGNGAANRLYGGAGLDYLDGGAGRDILSGGQDSDVYIVDDWLDLVIETFGGGNADEVRSSVSQILWSQVENLTLLGTANLNGTGQHLDNVLTGNAGANLLAGFDGDDGLSGMAGSDCLYGGRGDDRLDGGTGRDRLSGGQGRDAFVFSTALAPDNVDTIEFFSRHDDQILLDHAVFSGLGIGSLASGAFRVIGRGGSVDATDRILYDARSGNVFFDQDGNGTQSSAICFANLVGRPEISFADFTVL